MIGNECLMASVVLFNKPCRSKECTRSVFQLRLLARYITVEDNSGPLSKVQSGHGFFKAGLCSLVRVSSAN